MQKTNKNTKKKNCVTTMTAIWRLQNIVLNTLNNIWHISLGSIIRNRRPVFAKFTDRQSVIKLIRDWLCYSAKNWPGYFTIYRLIFYHRPLTAY